jgi:Mnd1 HTH domain
VKGLVKSLLDEGQLQSEKIGAGNWYWAPWNDPGTERQKAIQNFSAEKEKRADSVEALRAELSKKEQQIRDTPTLIDRAAQLSIQLEHNRASFAALQCKLVAIKGSDSMAVIDEKKKKLGNLGARAEHWEDNLEILKSYVTKLAGGDASAVKQLLRSLGATDEEELESSEPEAKRRKTK